MKYILIYSFIAALSIIYSCNKHATPDTSDNDIICNCDYQHALYVKGSKYLWAPNAFTPNKDGINDEFQIMHNEMDSTNFGLYIFDPNQKLIYTSSDINKTWSGPATYVSGNYPVILKYMSADGTLMEDRFCIYLLPFDSANNCFKTNAVSKLYFPDQFDPVTVSAKYNTHETFCP